MPAYIGWLNDPQANYYSNQRFIKHNALTNAALLAHFSGSDDLFVSIRDRFSENAIGTMTTYINPSHGAADMGLFIGCPLSWGKGYGQNAWNTLGNWLLNIIKIRDLTAGTVAKN